MKKRIFSLLLCIVMCLSLFPMSAFAEVTPAEMAFRFQVTVNGNEPSDEEFGKFTFYFDELKRPGLSNPWENLRTAENGSINGSGDINFRSLDYSYGDEGTHWYRFYEDQEKIKDYTLDQTVFYLKVVILEDGVGADTEFRIYETRAYKAPFGADVYDNAGVVDRDKLTAIALDDIVFANTYGDPADYSEVTDALNACKALKASDYTSDSWQALQNAINGVVYDLDADHQADVDAMARTIWDAIDALETVHTTHDFTGEYKDNGDGTHSKKCTICDEYGMSEAHSFTNGVCVCGAEDLQIEYEQKEILPFSQYNVVFDETDNMNHYYYEGTNFTITGSSLVDERGVVAGNKWYPLTVKSNDPAVIITRVEAVVSYFGEDYDLVGIDKGEKMELDEVENGTTVHINNIDSDSFSFVGGEGTASFSNITVYYVGTPNTCEHSFTGEYLNNGDTHLRKCAYCDVYGAEESHTFVKHKCVCGALETVQKSELLPFNMNNINDDNTYTYVGDDFTLYNSPAPFGYGMNVGGTSQLTITSNDPSLVINRIEAVVYMAGTHYNTIIPSSGVKLEKGGVANGTTVHVNNIDASTFSFTGLGDNGCKMTDITVFYTNGELIHKYNGEYKDNGTTHSPKCTECDEYGKEEAHDFSGDYKNNGETHSQKCTVCGVYGPDVQHIYENGVCACGAEDPSEFVITEDGTLIKYNGLGGDIILPAGILAINDGVFEGNNTITSVEFPYYDGENVMVLGASAFKDCKNLTNVVLPETITRIGANAFAGCESLSNITISNTVSARFLGNGAFDANYLKTVSFPCYLDEDTMADMMGRYGDFTYKQLDHNYVNHECTVCGAISDHDFTGDCVDNGDGTHSRKCTGCDQYGSPEAHSYTDYVCICGAEDLETVKAAATAELNAAIAAAKCGEAKEVLTQALNDLATAQTVAAVKGIAGNAKNTANQYDNDYSTRLVGYTSALDAELNKPTASESLKARIEKLKEDIANAPTISELDRLFLSNIADIQLEGLKDAAVSEINAAKTDANASIAEAAVTAIGSAQSEDEINTIKSKALANMAKADAELAAAKKNAIGTINAYKSDVNASVADAAIADINNATTAAEVSNIVNQTIPKLLGADRKAEFKEKITNELLPAAKCDEARAILNKALTDLDDAVTIDDVNGIFYTAQGQAGGKDSEFEGKRNGYTSMFNSLLTENATDETKAYAADMKQALADATSIAQIDEIYNNNVSKVGLYYNRDNNIAGFNKYIDSDEYSDEMKAIAQEAIEKLMQAESVSDVEKITKDYKLKLDVQEDKETMREVLASDEYSDEMKALAQNALDELDDVTTSQELTNLWDKYNPLMRLQLTKDDARKEVKELLPENASDAVKKIVSDACDEIQANDDPNKYADIIEAARQAVKAQLEKEAELAPAKEAAIAEINDAKTDANASVAEDAVKAINNAQSEDEISALKEQALADMAAADAAAELTAAKETAKKAILAEQGDDTSEAVAKAVEDALAAIEAATTVDEVNAAMEDGIAAIKDAKAGNIPPVPVTYTILNGANSVWTKGSTSGLVVRSDAPFAKFVGVKVDGKTIAATNYTAKEGSTIITLTSTYLETLETGKHSIEIVSTDGSASTNFTVKANSQPADSNDPQTGDSSMIYLWMLILAISAAGLSAMTVYSRKRKIK